MISGEQLIAGTVIADQLAGGTLSLLSDETDGRGNHYVAGEMTITGADTSDFAVDLTSYGALRMEAGNGAVYIAGGGAHLTFDDGVATMQGESAYIELGTRAWVYGHLYPGAASRYNCGNSYYPWVMVYGDEGYFTACYVDGEGVTSDRNKKHDIFYDLDGYEALFDQLRPVGYKLNNGTSGRVHIGMIAQDVEDTVALCGMTGQDFGAVVRKTAEDGTEQYYLRYTEFIGLLIDQVQKLKARVATLEGGTV